MQIITPSSHAALIGEMWIDDVALCETDMLPITPVSNDLCVNEE